MFKPKPPLMIPDRRRRTRIVTLRNFRNLMIVLLVVFVGISIRSEMRGRHAARDYGRLLDHQLQVEVPRKPVEVVREEPPQIDDQASADPMLVAPLRSEHWIQSDVQPQPAPMTATSQIVVPREGESRVAIVGGPDGVALVEQKRRKPVLSGGFGR